MPARALNRNGFTLLELSIVLAIIGTILYMGLTVFTGYTQALQWNATVTRMDNIESALLNFATVYGRIPCPSDLTQIPTSATYGFEAGAGAGSSPATGTGACTGGSMVPVATSKAASGTVEGGVPTRALQLTDDYMYDAWGKRLRYAADPAYTKTGALPVAAACSTTVNPDATAITVNDSTGAARTNNAAYAIISSGSNGHGAYTSNGVMFNAGNSNANKLTNCNCTNAGVANGTYVPTYVEMMPTVDSTGANNNFDDIVTFKDAWQLQTTNFPLTAASCNQYVYVTDQNNFRVEAFNMSGTFLLGIGAGYNGVAGSIGSAGDANGQFSTSVQGIATDSSGNIWVVDTGGQRVEKFNSSGTYLSQIPCASGSCLVGPNPPGSFGNPNGLAIDKSGNIWVSDGYYRILKFNSSGSFIMQFPCASGSCSSGSANGEFGSSSGPQQVSIDPVSGNLWVVDYNNNRMEEFNSSGTFLLGIGAGYQGVGGTIGSSGTTKGQFVGLYGVAVDASSNVYVADTGNNRVQKFNSSGTWLSQIGCAGSSLCSSSNANGKFSSPDTVSVDSSGNIWVTDDDNQRVEEFNSSGSYLMSIGASYNGVAGSEGTSGTANGQFNTPNYIAFGR